MFYEFCRQLNYDARALNEVLLKILNQPKDFLAAFVLDNQVRGKTTSNKILMLGLVTLMDQAGNSNAHKFMQETGLSEQFYNKLYSFNKTMYTSLSPHNIVENFGLELQISPEEPIIAAPEDMSRSRVFFDKLFNQPMLRSVKDLYWPVFSTVLVNGRIMDQFQE